MAVVKIAELPYALGRPGMIAGSSYKHVRQHIADTTFTSSKTEKFYFGCAAIAMANGVIGDGSMIGKFAGVFVDNQKIIGKDYYEKNDLVTLLTLGEIWVKVGTGLTIYPYEPVTYVTTAIETNYYGSFSNAGADGTHILLKGYRFLTPNVNGMAVIGFPFGEET
jgi:hypothetical protein